MTSSTDRFTGFQLNILISTNIHLSLNLSPIFIKFQAIFMFNKVSFFFLAKSTFHLNSNAIVEYKLL